MAKPASLTRDEIRQQNLLKLLEIENGYTVTDYSGKIWAFTGDTLSPILENRLSSAREQALDFMDDWYKAKNGEDSRS